ncbi:MAG: hypothetical protein HFH63_10045 [Lachnospiraceae bacterium]|nr:hypothetical protein [Lachnospiraceae bacterium]
MNVNFYLKFRRILCLIFFKMILFTSCTENKTESEEAPNAKDNEQKTEFLGFHDFTELEVITDCAEFTPVTQDQSYCFETDMNPSCIPEKRITDAENIVYMSQAESGLFAEGSYVYFAILENYASFAAGRYNIETNQIEQFTGMERPDDYYNGNQKLFESDLYLAYTWDGAVVSEILNTNKYHENSHNPLDIFSREEAELVGSAIKFRQSHILALPAALDNDTDNPSLAVVCNFLQCILHFTLGFI